jgi:hypothetical protein
MSQEEFFSLLFNEGEGVCCGDQYSNKITDVPKPSPFFTINPLDLHKDHGFFLKDRYEESKPRRADLNVIAFRNFMFEMDDVPLDLQLEFFKNSKIPFTSIVYSGGKSMHAILSVEPSVAGECHTLDGIQKYKHVWKRLAALLNREIKESGRLEYPANGYIDQSCKNPSRLSRFPGFTRDNGKVQEVKYLGTRMERYKFEDLLRECPEIAETVFEESSIPEQEFFSVEDFKAACPAELLRKLTIVTWAASAGMYNELYKLSLWAIDSTGVSFELFIEFLEQYTFSSLIKRGYPRHKLYVGVQHAYKQKGRYKREAV